MSLPELDNPMRIGQLKAEPRNEAEVRRMLAMARIRLADAQLASLSAQAVLPAPTMPLMRQPWPPFAGMAIAVKTATPCFSVSRTH